MYTEQDRKTYVNQSDDVTNFRDTIRMVRNMITPHIFFSLIESVAIHTAAIHRAYRICIF